MSRAAGSAKLTTPLCSDVEGGARELVAPPTALRLSPLMRTWLIVGGCPTQPRSPVARALARIWSAAVTVMLALYSLSMAFGAAAMTVEATDCWQVSTFFVSLFWLANVVSIILVLRTFRHILSQWRVDGQFLCPSAGTRLDHRAAAAAVDALPEARVVAPPSNRLLLGIFALFLAVGAANIAVYSAASHSLFKNGPCARPHHNFSSPGWSAYFLSIGFFVYTVPAGLCWALVPLTRSLVDATHERLTAPAAELRRSSPSATQDRAADDGAEAVWDAYRGAVAQADALSAQLAPLWVRGFTAIAIMVVGNLFSFWAYAFTTDLGSNRAFLLLVTALSSLASFAGVALLLHQPVLVHTRATVALERALATEGALSLPSRAALHSMLARRPVAFTVCGVALTQTLLFRMLAAMAASFIPPAFKALLSASAASHP